MSFETPAQQAIFSHLNGNIGATVYDDVPDLPSGMPLANFPYVVIGDDTSTAWDTDDRTGANVTVTLHVWSRASGFKETKAILAAIYERLNRAQLTADGFNIIDCLWEFSDAMRDPDGQTRHGVARYRITMQKV